MLYLQTSLHCLCHCALACVDRGMALAGRARDANQTRRLLALAVICDGGSRSDAARTSRVGFQIVCDSGVRFKAEGPAGLIDRKAPGPSPRLDEAQRLALAELTKSGTTTAVGGDVRWRLVDLAQWVWAQLRIDISSPSMACSRSGCLGQQRR